MSFQGLLENEFQKITKRYISHLSRELSKDFNIPEKELCRWNERKIFRTNDFIRT